MSSTSMPNDSPDATPIQPLHNPSQAAHVVMPQAPLGNVVNQAPGMGARALLAKKMAKSLKPNFVSPTDNMMTPCSQKLSDAKKKHFTKYVYLCFGYFSTLQSDSRGAKPVQLFVQKEGSASDGEADDTDIKEQAKMTVDVDEDENPF
ncbi:uncharacterized protein BT62DRAFT_677589 [Guyanagaster necrorhizus]|uniref:Uncharacterized protein n=1 Tax=Guyanagaster necrorhizus TaxID=856835 RepID=A0A9P7W0W0_9AGAR|nr:uncharacterized protein BT62DRAFT_677589 [Guyanagaster necrorhizus MCA 3950]KAG7449321.1 hypothetical protein BT62DRAFT_677589 [Guyanagaster necrorhizus MCA 3950]